MSQFTDTLHDFVQASNAHNDADVFAQPNREDTARELAAAGDRLESVLREMIKGVAVEMHNAMWED